MSIYLIGVLLCFISFFIIFGKPDDGKSLYIRIVLSLGSFVMIIILFVICLFDELI